jgi:hypothetical protein
VGPDELRQLAHQLETSLDVVDLAERIEQAGDKADYDAVAIEIRNKIEEACLKADIVMHIAQQMFLVGKVMKTEEDTVAEVFGKHPSTYPEMETEAQVLAFRTKETSA